MDKLVIQGATPLCGSVTISGSKNAALPIMAATLLSTEPVILHNIPRLQDIKTMSKVLLHLGADIDFGESMYVRMHDNHQDTLIAPYELVKTMRASIVVLGPLLTRFKKAQVSLPGGCAIGSRPVDFHLKALQLMGADIHIEDGYIHASCPNGLVGRTILFEKVTVTGTENIMMAAVLASGKTTIKNAAKEPEVADLARFLNKIGAKISGIGTSTIEIEGVEKLGGGEYTVIPDRIEAGTYLTAGAITKGKVTVNNVHPDALLSILHKFEESGAEIIIGDDFITLDTHGAAPSATNVSTAPYPAFPTDMQAQFMALNAIAKGAASMVETIFENRFMHVQELQRMGAHIKVHGNTAIVHGVAHLKGAPVMATDLRAAAGLILAALSANGKTVIDRIYHADRGYETLEAKLQALGAEVERLS